MTPTLYPTRHGLLEPLGQSQVLAYLHGLSREQQIKMISAAVSHLRMTCDAWRLARRGQVRLIHARSYLSAAVAWTVWRLTGTPFIFDMRALWPEEMIAAGRLKRGSVIHRLIVGLVRQCLGAAAPVVCGSDYGIDAHLNYLLPSCPKRASV